MSEFIAITYVGRLPGYLASFGNRSYEFEWRKSLGIGNRTGEVRPGDAKALSQIKDRRSGKRIFFLDKKFDIIN